MIHVIKLSQPYFDHVWNGLKDFEVRKNDRNYQLGDRLKMVESTTITPIPGRRYILKDIKYILHGGQHGIAPGYVVIGLKDV